MNDVVLWRRLVAELLGSAFLAAVVIGSGIAAVQLSGGNVGLELFEKLLDIGVYDAQAALNELDKRAITVSQPVPRRMRRRRSRRTET